VLRRFKAPKSHDFSYAIVKIADFAIVSDSSYKLVYDLRENEVD